MLCVASGDHNIDCVKLLLISKADFTLLDIYNNSVLHIAALNSNNLILEYLAKNLKIDIFARNKDGDTALTLCERVNNTEGAQIMLGLQKECD